MRNIQVSTDVFAAIWASRQPGENSEEEVLRRVFGVKSVEPQGTDKTKLGFRDARYDVEMEEGFEFFRHYKGTDYIAKATGGSLLLTNTGELYPSLNELSRAIGTWENAWGGWLFKDETGERKTLDSLRDQSKVRRRNPRSTLTLDDLDP